MDEVLPEFRVLMTQEELRSSSARMYRTLLWGFLAFCIFTAVWWWGASAIVAGTSLLGPALLLIPLPFTLQRAYRAVLRGEAEAKALQAKLQERLLDDLFLRYGLIPKTSLHVELDLTFLTTAREEVRGRVTIAPSGAAVFSRSEEENVAPFA